MKRFVLALLFALTWPAGAQQRKESLTLRLQLNPLTDSLHNNVTVRIYNMSARTVNVWMPKGLACVSAPGALSLQWSFQPTERAALAAQVVQTTCGEPTPGLSPFPVTERVAKQQHTWIALKPGQYTEVQDALSRAGISDVAGKYEARAVYTAPNFNPEQKQHLRAGQIETPKGQYRSEAVKFIVPE